MLFGIKNEKCGGFARSSNPVACHFLKFGSIQFKIWFRFYNSIFVVLKLIVEFFGIFHIETQDFSC